MKFISITAGEGQSAVGYVSTARVQDQLRVLNSAYSSANIGFTLDDHVQVDNTFWYLNCRRSEQEFRRK